MSVLSDVFKKKTDLTDTFADPTSGISLHQVVNIESEIVPNKFDKPLLIEILVIILKPAARH